VANQDAREQQSGCDIGEEFLQTEEAAEWFEKAIEEREPAVVSYLRHPLMKPLQAGPRWPALARMMKLPVTEG
jgi:hypothetical protein